MHFLTHLLACQCAVQVLLWRRRRPGRLQPGAIHRFVVVFGRRHHPRARSEHETAQHGHGLRLLVGPDGHQP